MCKIYPELNVGFEYTISQLETYFNIFIEYWQQPRLNTFTDGQREDKLLMKLKWMKNEDELP